MKICNYLIFALVIILCSCAAKKDSRLVYQFTNGHWYDGVKFRNSSFYSVDGIFYEKKPRSSVSREIDLKGRYVIPPLGEAHNHNLGGGDISDTIALMKTINNYIDNGIMYVKIPGNDASNKDAIKEILRKDSIPLEVAFADEIITAKDGHPLAMILNAFKRYNIPIPKMNELDGSEVFIIESIADLEEKWDDIISSKPDFIKTVLRYSEDFDGRRADSTTFGYNGIHPELLSSVVSKAKESELSVTVHLNSASDFDVAVRAGVKEIAHMPGYRIGRHQEAKDNLISKENAILAGEKNITVVTTTQIAELFASGSDLAITKDVQRANLKILHENGVRLALGSDVYDDNSTIEFKYIHKLGVFNNKELLDIWTRNTAQTILPNRKVGILKDGYEANFILLDENPVDDIMTLLSPIGVYYQGNKYK